MNLSGMGMMPPPNFNFNNINQMPTPGNNGNNSGHQKGNFNDGRGGNRNNRTNKRTMGQGNQTTQKKEMIEPLTMQDFLEKVVTLSKDHSGSRLVQKKYEESSQEDRDKIFEKIQTDI